MRLRLTENIKEIINIERGKFVSNLKFHLSDKFQLFPDQILTGKIMNNKLKARINPPGGWVDPFKSIVTGEFDKDVKDIHIHERIIFKCNSCDNEIGFTDTDFEI